MAQAGRWTDEQVDTVIARILRLGVIAAAVLVLAGGVLHLVREGGEVVDYGVFVANKVEFGSLAGIVSAAMRGDSQSLILVGLLVLIATPVTRVVFAAWAFWKQRDGAYVLISLVVLGVLLFSLVRGGL